MNDKLICLLKKGFLLFISMQFLLSCDGQNDNDYIKSNHDVKYYYYFTTYKFAHKDIEFVTPPYKRYDFLGKCL